MKHFTIIEIAQLTAMITGGGYKRTANKDIAVAKFNEAVALRNESIPTKVPEGWANGLTFAEAKEHLTAILKGEKAPAPMVKPVKVREKKNGGRVGQRTKKLFPTTGEKNPFRSGASKTTFDAIMGSPGKSFREYVNMGLRGNTIAFAIRNGWLRTED